jgi:SAM-dependent methyltransferase
MPPTSQEALERYLRSFDVRSPSYHVVRTAGARIRALAPEVLHGRLLDIGCGAKLKALLVGDLVDEYVGLDHAETLHGLQATDLIGTAYDIPSDSAAFDCVLSTAVLEHLERPGDALREAWRVLKPGGKALYTAPLYWHLHEEPRDFYRYTSHGLRFLFEEAGFEVTRIEALGGFWTTFCSEWSYYLQRFRRGPLQWPVDACVVWAHRAAHVLDRGRLRDERFTWLYLVVARKPE